MIFSHDGTKWRTLRQYQRLARVPQAEWDKVDPVVKARMAALGITYVGPDYSS